MDPMLEGFISRSNIASGGVNLTEDHIIQALERLKNPGRYNTLTYWGNSPNIRFAADELIPVFVSPKPENQYMELFL
jgi:hypothetical protein